MGWTLSLTPCVGGEYFILRYKISKDEAIAMFTDMGLKNMHRPNKAIDFNKIGTDSFGLFAPKQVKNIPFP